jgi:MYXO-CTERM domain-containing protein
MDIRDEAAATDDGFDVARIRQLVSDAILPKVLEEMEPIPVSGSVFSFGDFAVIMRSLTTNKAYLAAGVDLFHAPDNDTSAPDTQILSAPATISNPHDAVLKLGGSDAEIPSELLQYVATIDGVEAEPSFLGELKVGEVGTTATYEVRVAAMDLAGNVDPTPATASVTVDGVAPFVMVQGARRRSGEEGPVQLGWNMSDDTTADEALRVRVEIYDVEDPTDILSARLIDTQELGAGASSTTVELEQVGGLYRVEVHVLDEAGNDSQSSLLLQIASSGGCSVGGSGNSGATSFLLLLLGLVGLRRRRN